MTITLQKTFDIALKITKWLAIVGAVCLALMMILNVIDVVASKWLGWSVPGAMDISEELMVLMTIFPMAYIAIERGHISITILEDRASPRMQLALKILQYLIGIGTMGFVTWRAFSATLTAYASQRLKAGIDLPTWPGNLAVVIGFAFLTLAWILMLIKILVDKKASEA